MERNDERYFEEIEGQLDEAFAVAEAARERGGDPTPEIEIPVAKDMADRVENILGIEGVAERVRELEGEMSREEAALELAADFAEGRVGDYETRAGTIEGAVRTAVALLTEGVVAAPIEGIDRVELADNPDGTQFVRVFYAGPIRSAGGTAQALSVLVADYTRALLGVAEYQPRDEEVERYAEEVDLYDSETGLQYSPKDAETKFIARNCPVMLDGEATGQEEVSGFRDLERVGTNNPRGGMCLVLGEGIAQKAPKIERYTSELDEIDWPWLDDLIAGTIDGAADEETDDEPDDESDADESATETDDPAGPLRPDPSGKFLRDLIAGRPVFGHPSEAGGFRLRYGRARNHGFATAGVHPATMHLVDDFLATGTQLKTERPGKAAGVVPVDSIEGPTVRLANGDVRRIDDPAEALELRNGVEAILDLGEYLVNYGEFVENNHPLAPASYTYEWWIQEFEATAADVRALADSTRVDLEHPVPERAIEWATEYDAPLHPDYTYCWHDIAVEDFERLREAVAAGEFVDGTLALEPTPEVREALEALLLPHSQAGDALRIADPGPFVRSLGFDESLDRRVEDISDEAREWPNAMAAVREVAPFALRERAPTRIGGRMGRPEKSETRELSPAVHTLFPIGEAGGNQRDVSEATEYVHDEGGERGVVPVEIGRRECTDCGERSYETRCPDCGAPTEPRYECPDCEIAVEPDESGQVECPRCGSEARPTEWQAVNLREEYQSALGAVGERESAFDIMKGVKGLTSELKTPEPMEKGVLRAKHGVSTFKDGTVRYDMTDLPVTSVRPAELDVTVEQFRELGYHEDMNGDPLRHDDQLVELKVQDIVLSNGAAEHMLRTADFVDDLLESYYELESFYDLDDRDDLVGELVFGMAPHTSAAVVGRVIGFTSAAVGYAHPYFHASKRRNCFHPETKLWVEDGDGWRHERISALVEESLDDPREDDFGTLVEELDGEIRVPSIDNDGGRVRKPVEAVSKHPAPDHLVEIETRSGRELTVTPDHSMVRWADGIEDIDAREIETGDSIPSPKRIDYDGEAASFDLLEAFLDADAVPNDELMIRGVGSERLKSLFDDATDETGHVKPIAEALDCSDSTVYNWIGRDSVPASVLSSLFGDAALLDRLPADVSLSVKRDKTSVARTLEIDEEFATLLGYYAAEGFTRREAECFYQTTICTPDDAARRDVIDAFEEALGIEAYEENEWKVTASNRLVAALFADVFDAGTRAETKRIPDCMTNAPAPQLRAFLAAYFSGDGSVSSDRIEIRATTVSDELKRDLVAALKRFGIAAKTYEECRVPSSGAVAAFHDGTVPEYHSWTCKITSENAVRFAEVIGFHLDRKSRTLSAVLDAVDVRTQRLLGDGGSADIWLDEVVRVDIVESAVDHVYSLTVAETNRLVANDLFVGQCDGDEDCVMLLMDGLLNFSKAYLPDKRGGSVAEDSRLVAVDPDDNVRFLTFDAFWRELESPIEADGKYRKRTCVDEGWRTYTFDETHEATLQPIEKAIRYRADEDEGLLRVTTQFGRSVEITANHSLFRYDDGIEEVAGDELSEGDLLLAPRELDVEAERTTIDATECVDDPYVVIDDHVEDLLRSVWETFDRGSEAHDAFASGLSYRLSKDKIAYDRLDTILDHGGYEVPTDAEIALKGSSDGIERTIDIDEEFAWLLGLFVAEGTTSSVCPAIHNAEEDLIDRAETIIEAKLGHEPGRRWSNRAYELRFPAVFREVLYALGFERRGSYNASEKVVPDPLLRAPREVVLSFLRGFIAGDGSESSDDNYTSIAFHTTSDDVRDGIVFLLHRLGLVANVSTTDRNGNRQDIHAVSVSGGASANPLRRVLNDDESYHPKSLVVSVPDALLEIREMAIDGCKQLIPKYLKRRENVSLEKLREIVEELDRRELPSSARNRLDELRPLVDGDLSYLRVEDIERVDYDGHLYDLQVGGEPIFLTNWLYAHNSMDAPLVMSSRIDPAEIDDEAHNMDVVESYPREFYEATLEMADPGSVDIEIGEESVGTEDEYSGFRHTHDTSNLALGPSLSAYKTLGSMTEKMDAQLELARKLRAVDETDVAERIIEYHFLPDLIGNLRAFSRQETRCLDCGTKYRRMPLSGSCRECGGDVNLTVHEGSVKKYIDTATRVAEEYGTRDYTKQRLEVLERTLESVFENDKNKQSGIADFM